jgi:hypothetical protein
MKYCARAFCHDLMVLYKRARSLKLERMLNQQLYHDKNPLIKKYVLKETNKTEDSGRNKFSLPLLLQSVLYQFKNKHIVSQIIDVSMLGHYKSTL